MPTHSGCYQGALVLSYMTYFVERNENGHLLGNFIMANSREVTRENRYRVLVNICCRDAVSLDEHLRNMSGSERSLALNADQSDTFDIFQGDPPLIQAVTSGYLDVVEVLLKYKGEEVDIEVGGEYHRRGRPLCTMDDNHSFGVHHVSFTCCTPLFLAASRGHLDVLRCLLENGADINASTADNCTPLMIAIENGNINAATFLIEHGANVDLKDDRGDTALDYAMSRYILYDCNASLEVCSCLIEHGADVNGRNSSKGPSNSCTPLMVASRNSRVDLMTLLIKHGADVNLQDEDGETALHVAMCGSDDSCEVLRCLIENGANINAVSNDGRTSLMNAIGNVSVVTFLTEHGANIDLQDKNGNTALHYAVCRCPLEAVHHLVTLGASHMCNNKGFTPLLLASNTGRSRLVEYLIQRPEMTKEQRIDSLELLGTSLVFMGSNGHVEGFKYIKLGMEERFSDPSHPLSKQPMEPVEAYQNRKECQTLEELAQIEGDVDAVFIEGVIMRERIIGNKSPELLYLVTHAAMHKTSNLDFSTRMGLFRHVVKMTQSIKQRWPATNKLHFMSMMLHEEFMRSGQRKAKIYVVELLELTILEYETQHKALPTDDDYKEHFLSKLFDISMKLVLLITKIKFCGESKTSHLSMLLRKLCRKDPQDRLGNTLLHKVIECHMDDEVYSCLDTVKLLLNSGFNVNAMNNKGSTPLHIAATFEPSEDKICLLTELLQVLVDGGAHHDFVNSDGETPIDMAKTDEARLILSESKNLELQCISARAVRKYRIPYIGVVPVILEKYICRHRGATPSREERLCQKYLHTILRSIYEPF